MSNRKLRIIIVFGLDDGKLNFPSLLEWVWNTKQVRVHAFRAGWRSGRAYPDILESLLRLIDQLLADGDEVAVIGISAGASLAVNAYALRPQLLGIVNVCGALRLVLDMPTRFGRSVASSEAFRQSVVACVLSQQSLSANQLGRVLVMMPRSDFVPLRTMSLFGAKVCRVLGFNHVQSILTAMLLYRGVMVRFLRQSA